MMNDEHSSEHSDIISRDDGYSPDVVPATGITINGRAATEEEFLRLFDVIEHAMTRNATGQQMHVPREPIETPGIARKEKRVKKRYKIVLNVEMTDPDGPYPAGGDYTHMTRKEGFIHALLSSYHGMLETSEVQMTLDKVIDKVIDKGEVTK